MTRTGGRPLGSSPPSPARVSSSLPGADDRLGRAVVDDVGRLRSGQVGVDGHVVQPGATRRPHHRVHVLVVLHQDRDGVAFDQTGGPEQVGQSVGPGLQLTERHDRSGRIHDDGGLVGRGNGGVADLHEVTLRRLNLTGVNTGLASNVRTGRRFGRKVDLSARSAGGLPARPPPVGSSARRTRP